MSFGCPVQPKVKINFCSPREMEAIPGVGKKTADLLWNIRDTQGNITPELFATIGVRNLPAAMEAIDFELWSPQAGKVYRWNTYIDAPVQQTVGLPYRSRVDPFQDHWTPECQVPMYQPDRYLTGASLRYESSSQRSGAPNVGYDARWNQYRSPYQATPTSSSMPMKMDPLDPCIEESRVSKPKPRVHVPKSISYDGKSDWQAFIVKFSSYADREEWNSRTRKDALSWVLEGSASKFFANLTKRNPDLDYFEAVNRLAKRFDMRELPETSQMLFMSAFQGPKESLVEWCDRIATLASEAFPDWTEEQTSRQAVMRFCQGCTDKSAGFHVINTKPASLEEAMDEMKRYQQTSMAIYGRPSKVMQVQEDCEASYVQAYQCPQGAPTPRGSHDDRGLSARVKRLERNMDMILKSIRDLKVAFRSIESRMTMTASAQILEQLNESQTPKTPVMEKSKRGCFHCGDEGHLRASCPQRTKARQSDEGGEEGRDRKKKGEGLE